MEVSVLGPVEVRLAGAPVDLGTPKQRALVAALALSGGRPVSVDGIVDLLWGDGAPPGVTGTLQGYVSHLRRVLEPGRQRRAPAEVLVTVAPGYALRVPGDDLDAHRFERAVSDEHRRLQPLPVWGAAPLGEPDLERSAAALAEALDLWRGTPYAELGDADPAVAERARLEELRLVAVEDRAVVELALGRHAAVVAELEALIAAHPLRERLWALCAVALTRSGRQADALDALARLRGVLDEELGIEPSADLRELQAAVLRQDPDLEWVRPRVAATASPPVPETPDAPRPSPGPAAEAEPVAPWPMVGRDEDLAALLATIERADGGAPSYAVITGEPGIGKSRLAAELIARARQRGMLALVGRCSQDDGAPPLWPWRSVLEGLGASLLDETTTGAAGDGGDGEQFRAWERIVETVRSAARDRTVVVVLDDLQWADASTLRVLRLLVETSDLARLLVVATWRSPAEASGLLAEVSEALARMHAVRVELSGLAPTEAAAVFASIASRELAPAAVAVLRERTDGNPFFLVELARLGSGGGEGEELPGAVADVLNQRLARLPEATVAALRSASVIGRTFDVPTLATVTGIDEDDLLDVVEPAQAAGLVREDGIDRYLFAHALVRDTLRAGLSLSRRARTHARVAEALSGAPGRETELARHWREAGPSYADRAWRAAVDAADLSRRLYAYDEAAELLEGALVSLDGDGQGTPRDRYAILTALIESYRWAAQLPDLVASVEQAIETGKQLRDPEAVAAAAVSTSQGVLWRSAGPGEVNPTVVGALRGSLDRLPPEDGALRCRVLLALANELGESASFDELTALADEGLAMARRLGDPVLLLDACQIYFAGLWAPSNAPYRLEIITEAVELADRLGRPRAHLVSSVLRAAALGEAGRIDEMWSQAAAARAQAEELRIAFGELALEGLELPWLAMAGRWDDCARHLEHLEALDRRITHDTGGETVLAARLAISLWQGRSLDMVPVLEMFDESSYPFAASIAVFLWRAGEHERARATYAARGAPLEHHNEISLLAWAHGAELALYLGERGLAAGAYERLAPASGRSACGGSALAIGPVDAYLAMAAAAVGESELAARHADAALVQAASWRIPVFADWFAGLRRTHGF
ncbi:BTAD domain-containing putative transcriptional regulator [Nocardioides soli]|uniref:DNA-binding SARP family transcriptional activator n=1 Tax=Nocardioides soli TaxID=1036020 RepID=A0A7W4VS55_9ACTN|nr:DNA-binding SARP family transcriptional activator [Nocardioides soli]